MNKYRNKMRADVDCMEQLKALRDYLRHNTTALIPIDTLQTGWMTYGRTHRIDAMTYR